MTHSMKSPDRALQRSIGAKAEFDENPKSLSEIYATHGELQRRYVQRRCSLSHARARLVAAFCFGEVDQ